MFDKMVFAAIKQQMGSTVPLAKHLGIELNDVAAGEATATLPDAKHNTNHIGSQHAGALFALADTASGAAVAGAFGQKILQLRVVVSEASVKYTKTARGAIVARAHVVGDAKALVKSLDDLGKLDMPVDVELTNAENAPVAAMSFTWHISKPQKN
jgi:uncharacterized protein (TIGR00369 family)